jgi:hypothetical protein
MNLGTVVSQQRTAQMILFMILVPSSQIFDICHIAPCAVLHVGFKSEQILPVKYTFLLVIGHMSPTHNGITLL